MTKHFNLKNLADLREVLRAIVLKEPVTGNKSIGNEREIIVSNKLLQWRTNTISKEVAAELKARIDHAAPEDIDKARLQLIHWTRAISPSENNANIIDTQVSLTTLIEEFSAFEHVDWCTPENVYLLASRAFLLPKLCYARDITQLSNRVTELLSARASGQFNGFKGSWKHPHSMASWNYPYSFTHQLINHCDLILPHKSDIEEVKSKFSEQEFSERQRALAQILELYLENGTIDRQSERNHVHPLPAAIFLLLSNDTFSVNNHTKAHLDDPINQTLIKHGKRLREQLYTNGVSGFSNPPQEVLTAHIVRSLEHVDKELNENEVLHLEQRIGFPRQSVTLGWLNILEQGGEIRPEERIWATQAIYTELESNAGVVNYGNLVDFYGLIRRFKSWCERNKVDFKIPSIIVRRCINSEISMRTASKANNDKASSNLLPEEIQFSIFKSLESQGMLSSEFFPVLIERGIYIPIRTKLSLSDLLKKTPSGRSLANVIEDLERNCKGADSLHLVSCEANWYVTKERGPLTRSDQPSDALNIEVSPELDYYLTKTYKDSPTIELNFAPSGDQAKTPPKKLAQNLIRQIDGKELSQVNQLAKDALEDLQKRIAQETLPNWAI